MAKHQYKICNKCKGHGYCEAESQSNISCVAFVKANKIKPWKNPTIDSFQKYQELLKKGKVTL
jgi:hypothetical protein